MRISLKNGIAITSLSDTWEEDPSARGQLSRKPKFDIFFAARKHRNRDRSNAPQGLDHVINEHLRRRGSGGDADSFGVLQPLRIQLASVSDQITRNTDL